MPRLLLLAALLLALVPVGAAAQSPTLPLGGPQQIITPEPTPVPAGPRSVAEDDNDLAGWQKVLIFVAGFGLIGGIAWVIIGDARRRAPVSAEDLRPFREETGAAARQRRADHRKQRERQKRARQSRKQNRPRRK